MSAPDPPGAGLCSRCEHVRVTRNRRGSVFYLCRRSRDDPRFDRYPTLPVLRCPGFEPGSAAGIPAPESVDPHTEEST